jgi:hypothetical protein
LKKEVFLAFRFAYPAFSSQRARGWKPPSALSHLSDSTTFKVTMFTALFYPLGQQNHRTAFGVKAPPTFGLSSTTDAVHRSCIALG